MPHLTPAEIAQYQQFGWVRPSFRLPEPQVTRMREALDDLIARNPGVRPEKLVSAHIEGDNGEGVKGSKAFLDLALDPVMEPLDDVGAEIRAFLVALEAQVREHVRAQLLVHPMDVDINVGARERCAREA